MFVEFGPSWGLYPLIVHGKPYDWKTVPAFFPIMFELTVLFSAFAAFFAVLIMNGLPRSNHPIFNWDRFSSRDQRRIFPRDRSARSAVHRSRSARTTRAQRRPAHHHRARGLIMLRGFLLISLLLTIAAVAVLGFRGQKSTGRAVGNFSRHGAADESARASAAWTFLPMAAARGCRSPERCRSVTKCRSRRRRDAGDGVVNRMPRRVQRWHRLLTTPARWATNWGTGIPVPVTPELLERGRQRFNITCAMCHGATAAGNGITKQYGLATVVTSAGRSHSQDG